MLALQKNMINFTQKWIVKLILFIVALSIVAALLSSGGGCYNPIEEIFIGWRDTSGCDATVDFPMESKNSRDIGGIVLTLVIFFALSIFSIIKIIKKLRNKTNDEKKR